jgi:FAD/FMN-containing dehydrogenase
LRDATYALNAISAWTGAENDAENIAWTRRIWNAVERLSPGSVYVNFLGVGDEGEDRVRAAYGPNYARLASIKATYDPANVFHLNHNIKPDGHA